MGNGILSRGKSSRDVMLTNHLQPVPSLRMGGAMLLLPHMCLHDVGMDNLTFIMGLSRRLFLALPQLGCFITPDTGFYPWLDSPSGPRPPHV
jgi:hypothetical protein